MTEKTAKQRVEDERADLQGKIERLGNFLWKTVDDSSLSPAQRDLLHVQKHIMEAYRDTLTARLAIWEE